MRYVKVRSVDDIPPNEQCRATAPYEVGLLAWPAFRDLLAYGRTFVTVEHYPAGGLLVRRGYVKVSGQTEDVRRFLGLWDRLAAREAQS